MERFGKFVAASFGDPSSVGYLFGLLEEVTRGDVYLAIKEDRPLIVEQIIGRKVDKVSAEEWEDYRNGFNIANIDLSYERMIKEFKSHRMDLLGIILSHPKGRKWLEGQVNLLREKLGC